MRARPLTPGRHEFVLLLLAEFRPVSLSRRAVEDRQKRGHRTILAAERRCLTRSRVGCEGAASVPLMFQPVNVNFV